MKKPIRDTKFGQFLSKAGSAIKENGGDVADIAVKAATGNISGAIAETVDLLKKGKDKGISSAGPLLDELTIRMVELQNELFELEAEDRANARQREIEMARTGRTDWMMYFAGITALGTFILMVFAIIFNAKFELGILENALFHQLMGIIEGVALTVFGYYFGTSKSSSDKQKIIDHKVK